MLFQKTWGLSDNGTWSEFSYVDQRPNGDFVLIGCTANNQWNDRLFYFCRTDSTGEILTEYTWGTPGWENFVSKVIVTNSGSYMVCGAGTPGARSFALSKIDEFGSLDFCTYYDFYLGDFGYDITPTPDAGYIICGTRGYSNIYPAFVKVDANGTEVWRRTQSTYVDYRPMHIAATPDSGFVVSGIRTYNDDSYYAKYDKDGYMTWIKYPFGITNSIPDKAEAVRCNDDGTIDLYFIAQMITGNPATLHSGRFIHCNASGDTIYTKWEIAPISLIFLVDSSNFHMINDQGDYLVYNSTTGFTEKITNGILYAKYYAQTSDGGYIAAGYQYTYDANYQNTRFQIVKYCSDGRYQPFPFLDNISLSPNPSLDGNLMLSFDVKTDEDINVSIWSSDGRLVYIDEIFCPANSHTAIPIHLDIATATAGVYILEIRSSGEYRRERVVIARQN